MRLQELQTDNITGTSTSTPPVASPETAVTHPFAELLKQISPAEKKGSARQPEDQHVLRPLHEAAFQQRGQLAPDLSGQLPIRQVAQRLARGQLGLAQHPLLFALPLVRRLPFAELQKELEVASILRLCALQYLPTACLLHTRSKVHEQPRINLQIARAHLLVSDAKIGKRAWQCVMDEIVNQKEGLTHVRWQVVVKSRDFDGLRYVPLLETRPDQFLRALDWVWTQRAHS